MTIAATTRNAAQHRWSVRKQGERERRHANPPAEEPGKKAAVQPPSISRTRMTSILRRLARKTDSAEVRESRYLSSGTRCDQLALCMGDRKEIPHLIWGEFRFESSVRFWRALAGRRKTYLQHNKDT